ncbi:hypothetical protein [Sinorhizobium meliloti]|uniref:hypothetical protein n=1 Tax=Rhizobium meliloti TaxID=382 RepID=UPI0020BF48BC|nr:hypothetical protein [Sinorhizobium meliloti]
MSVDHAAMNDVALLEVSLKPLGDLGVFSDDPDGSGTVRRPVIVEITGSLPSSKKIRMGSPSFPRKRLASTPDLGSPSRSRSPLV